MPRKKKADQAVRINVTLPPALFQAGQRIQQAGLYAGFADMIQDLIRDRYMSITQKPEVNANAA